MAKTLANPLTALTATLALRIMTDCEAEDRRSASPIAEDDDAWESKDRLCSPTSDDERSARIPTTTELEPLDDPTPSTIAFAIQCLKENDDWMQQHEAITVIRQSIVRHAALLTATNISDIVPALVLGCDNLRSALSKNALLALSECFEFLGLSRLAELLATARPVAMVDVVLRRATCEKRFLRDAALSAVDKLIFHLASRALIASAAHYAPSKNAKVVAIASRVMAQSFSRLKALAQWDVEQFTSGSDMRAVYEALAKFRAGKESAARVESMACLRLLGESLGRNRFEATLCTALSSQPHSVTSIVAEVFPPVITVPTITRRGSLKDRVMMQHGKPETC